MKIACKKETGINLLVQSGFRPAFGRGFVGKSKKGISVSASSQYDLRIKNCGGNTTDRNATCRPDTALPGSSRHGNGIAVDFNTGSRTAVASSAGFPDLNEKLYIWLVKNSWKYNMIRAVGSEEWHFEFWPNEAKKGPYGRLPAKGDRNYALRRNYPSIGNSDPNNLYFADLGLDKLSI
jgi:hypothetical protein